MSKREQQTEEEKENTIVKSRFFSIKSYFNAAENVNKRVKPAFDQQIEKAIELSINKEEELKTEQCPICQAVIYTASMSMAVHVNNCLDLQQKEENESVTTNNVTASSSSLDWKRFSNVESECSSLERIVEMNNSNSSSCTTKESSLLEKKECLVPLSSWKELFSSTSTTAAGITSVNMTRKEPTIKAVTKHCPFYKRVQDTRFTVDAFNYGKISDCDGYFLSHYHSDHYGGLRSKWSHGPIYCSKVTANLVRQELRVDSRYIQALPLNELCSIPGRGENIQVALIDANHCPGSVLFLFIIKKKDGSTKRHLHTGDFRAAPRMCLHPLIRQPENAAINCLYLDTTYLNPRYSFPAQEECIQAICDTVKSELNNNMTIVKKKEKPSLLDKWIVRKKEEKLEQVTEKNNSSQLMMQTKAKESRVLIVVGTYTIGKERVFINIAKMLNCKIYANTKKKSILTCQEDAELNGMLTDDPIQAQIHVVPLNTIKGDSMDNYLQDYSQYFDSLMAFKPTGWTFKSSPPELTAKDTNIFIAPLSNITIPPFDRTLRLTPYYKTNKIKLFAVPYSEHSSFRELACFISSLDIKQIIPTVNVSQHQTMSLYFDKWLLEKESIMKQSILIEYPNENHW